MNSAFLTTPRSTLGERRVEHVPYFVELERRTGTDVTGAPADLLLPGARRPRA